MFNRNVVINRYEEPNPILGVHYSVDSRPAADLVSEDRIAEFFELGNEIEFAMSDIWNYIPVEWKSETISEDWIRARVTVYDTIRRL